VGLTTWAGTITQSRLVLGTWHAQSIVPSFLLSILIRYQIPGTRWAVQVDHLEVHTNWLPILINISVPLLPVYQQASHVVTTLQKIFLIAVTRQKKHSATGVLHTQCNAVCQGYVMATAGMLAQGWEVDLPTPKAHLVLCLFVPRTPIRLLQLSHHACTHSQILTSCFTSRFFLCKSA